MPSGLDTSVLTLQWPDGVVPLELPNFETAARRMRYQALSEACRDSRVQDLLLAHHNDDQAETVLMRLVEGRWSEGLCGMKGEAGVPECFGRYGLCQSGGRELTALEKDSERDVGLMERKENPNNFNTTNYSHQKPDIIHQDGFEYGGIRIHRPLLKYSKQHLEKICRDAGLAWIEDETNRDPTKTVRNAIRQLLSTDSLPMVLRKQSLNFLAQRATLKAESRNERADELFQKCQVVRLDARSGRLIIRIPTQSFDPTPEGSELATHDSIEVQQVAARVIRRVVQIISPDEKISLSSLERVYKSMFHEHPSSSTQSSIQSAFTTCNVKFTCLGSSTETPDSQSLASAEIKDGKSLYDAYTWMLERQNPMRGNLPAEIRIPRRRKVSFSETKKLSSWQLWDRRFWLRVMPIPDADLVVCAATGELLNSLRQSLKYAEAKKLSLLLHDAVPGKSRFTLPILVEEEEGGRKRTPLALPTLGFRKTEGGQGLRWTVRYKQIELPRATQENWNGLVEKGVIVPLDTGLNFWSERFEPKQFRDDIAVRKLSRANMFKRERIKRRNRPRAKFLGDKIL